MKTKHYFFLLLVLISINLPAQFLIPIIIPYEGYKCHSKDEIARDYYRKAVDNFYKNVPASIAYFKGAIARDKYFCDAYFGLIQPYKKNQEFDKALEQVNLALDLNALDPWLVKQKGFLLFRTGEYHKAANYYDSLSRLQPRGTLWQFLLAESLIKLNLLDSAKKITMQMEYIEGHLEGADGNSYSLLLQGKIYCHLKDYKTALKAFDLIKDEFKQRPDFNYYYGLVLLNKEDANEKKALRYFRKAKRKGYYDFDPKIEALLNR